MVALSLPSASAALTDGKFLVHAQNTEDPTIEATAGLGGLKNGGGSADPENGGDVPGAVSYEAGDMKLTITPAMLAFSEANRKAFDEGRTGDIKTDPDGWQTIWYIDPSDQSVHPGVSEKDGMITFLSGKSQPFNMDEFYTLANRNAGDGVAFYAQSKATDTIQAMDKRGTPKEGATYIYMKIGNQASSLGRYMMSEGKLIGVYVVEQPGMLQVQRESAKLGETYSSERFPSLMSYDDSGNLDNISVKYSDKSRGYSRLSIYNRPDQGEGGVVVQFDDRTPGTGPKVVVLNGDKMVSFEYQNADGSSGTLSASSAAEYNAATGQNWDGKLAKFSDFDTSIPFRP